MADNKKNLIGVNRARRPHNAIFVSFSDAIVPSECLEAARNNWRRVCLKEHDKQVEEQLKKVCAAVIGVIGVMSRHSDVSEVN